MISDPYFTGSLYFNVGLSSLKLSSTSNFVKRHFDLTHFLRHYWISVFRIRPKFSDSLRVALRSLRSFWESNRPSQLSGMFLKSQTFRDPCLFTVVRPLTPFYLYRPRLVRTLYCLKMWRPEPPFFPSVDVILPNKEVLF